MKKMFYILLSALMVFGCDGYVQTDDYEELIVEGHIEDGGYPVVTVTTSLLSDQLPIHVDSLAPHIVRWARVKVSDGEKEVFLTGMRSKKLFPPYIYTTSEIKGVAGKTYTLTVDYGNVHASGSTTIPDSVPVEGIRLEKEGETTKAFVQFTDPQEQKNWYRLFVKVEKRDSTWMPSLFGLSDDSSFDGASEMQLRRGFGNNLADYLSDFKDGETLNIKLATCTETMYEYWKTFDNNMFYGRTPFFPAKESARGNLEGFAVHGYWTGYGIGTKTITIQ